MKKLTIKSSNDKLHLERVFRCVSLSIETNGWPSFMLDKEDIKILINYLNTQLTTIENENN